MRHMTLAILTISLLFLGCTTLATKDWEKENMAKGWNEVENKLLDRADMTFYAKKDISGGNIDMVFYISPDGKKFAYVNKANGFNDTGERRERDDGAICMKFQRYQPGKEVCITLWKKGELLVSYTDDGTALRDVWSMGKKGNLENLLD